MINLFEFASTILIHLAIARQDVQGFNQVDGLFGSDVCCGHEKQYVRLNIGAFN